jgi:hypothetical protein
MLSLLAASSFILLASADGSYPLRPLGPRYGTEAECRTEGEAWSSYRRHRATGGASPIYLCAGVSLPAGPNKEKEQQ